MELIWSHLDVESFKLWIKTSKSQFDLFKDSVAMRKVFYTVCSRQYVATIERLRKINYIVVDSPKILPPLREAWEELSSSEIASWQKGTKTKKTKRELLWRLYKEQRLAIWGKEQANENNADDKYFRSSNWPSQLDLEGFEHTTRATIPQIIKLIRHQFYENKKPRIVHIWKTINGKCITIARLTSMISIWDSEEEFMTKGELYLWENQAAAFFNQGGILQ